MDLWTKVGVINKNKILLENLVYLRTLKNVNRLILIANWLIGIMFMNHEQCI